MKIKVKKVKPIRGYIDGCFDIMHSGHYNAIRQAKQLCDILVVGVHSDDEILKHKGPPVMNENERLSIVKACKWCDEIVFDTPYNPSIKLLDKLNCDFVVHGDDTSTTSDGNDAYAGVRKAGRLKIIKRTEGVSTTDLVGRLLLMTKRHHLNSNSPYNSPMIGPVTSSNINTIPELNNNNNNNDIRSRNNSIKKQAQQPSLDEYNHNNKHYSEGLSSFLPTTWRISSFSNGKTPNKDDIVIYIDGAFDLFHIGHIETIAKAKALGSFLFVGIHDDETINKHKGKNYPIMNLHERVLNVLSCKYVDEVIIGAPWQITKDMITTFNIKKVVSGSNTKLDLDKSDLYIKSKDPYKVAKELNIYQQVKTENSLNTENVVERIINNRTKYQNRNKNRVKKDVNYLKKKNFIEEL